MRFYTSKLLHLIVVLATSVNHANAFSPVPGPLLKATVDKWFNDPTGTEAIYGPMEEWNIAAVTSFYTAFYYRDTFAPGPTFTLEKWDTSNVVDTRHMFGNCLAFNP